MFLIDCFFRGQQKELSHSWLERKDRKESSKAAGFSYPSDTVFACVFLCKTVGDDSVRYLQSKSAI